MLYRISMSCEHSKLNPFYTLISMVSIIIVTFIFEYFHITLRHYSMCDAQVLLWCRLSYIISMKRCKELSFELNRMYKVTSWQHRHEMWRNEVTLSLSCIIERGDMVYLSMCVSVFVMSSKWEVWQVLLFKCACNKHSNQLNKS